MDALQLLTDVDLMALASALRSGRLQPPYKAVAVGRFCDTGHAAAVTQYLAHLDGEGMQPRHLAHLAEAVLTTRVQHPQPADVIDLVWTGPETLGISNRDTGVVVRDLFGCAESEVLVAGFAVYQGREVFRPLAERMAEVPDLRVRLFLDVQRSPGDYAPDWELLRRFAHRFRTQEWPGGRLPEQYYDPRSLDAEAVKRSSLHAKCVVVDRRVALVTSANFTEAAQTRNIEVGALVQSYRFATRLAEHFEALATAGNLKPIDLSRRPE